MSQGPSCGDNETGDAIQTKPIADRITPLVQRQTEEEEEIQPKLIDGGHIQRQSEEEEEEEPVQTKSISNQVIPQVQKQEEEEEPIQTKPLSGKPSRATLGLQSQLQSLRGGGSPLNPFTRSFFEPRFGSDFSQVRLHTGSQAAGLVRSLNANAFTRGKDVVFGSGQYSPGTSSGRRLLAHELTHVLQQAGLPGSRKIQRKIRFEPVCKSYPYLKCAIYEAVRDVRRQVGLVLSALNPVVAGKVTSGRIVNLLNVHFHVPTAAQISDIYSNYQKLDKVLKSPPIFKCLALNAPQCKSKNQKGVTGGLSTVCGGGSIELCGMFKNFNCRTRSHIIIHELAHHDLCAAGDIYAGLHPKKYMTLSNTEAMQNADTYAQFAEMVDMGSPICRGCYLPSGARPVDEEVEKKK